MLSQRTLTVGGDEFTLQQYPTTKALSYGIAIGKIAGAMLSGGLDGDIDGDGGDDLFSILDAGGMVNGLLSQIDQVKTPELIKSLLKDAIATYQFNGETKTHWDDNWYEARFAGALNDLIVLLMAVFEDNFLDAIDVVKKKVRSMETPTREKSSASKTGGNGVARPKQESTGSFFG